MKRNAIAYPLRQWILKSIRCGVAGMLLIQSVAAQTNLPLTDLSSFQNPSSSWRIAGDVNANLDKANVLATTAGTGVLVNLPDAKNAGQDLLTQLQHGDADIELDFMMAKGSNSGIYLQGRYELQLMDSWGVKRASSADNGGVYERWDDTRGKGLEGFEGHAPRQNVGSAPGLWQHLKISFQAPRFDAAGKKIDNAKFLRVELNGVAIHENIELSGPTRGAMGAETAMGPLRFQGDHGAVAFQNIRLISYDKSRPELTNLKYSVYKGLYEKEPDFGKLPPEAEGPSGIITSTINNLPDSFLLRYTGTLKIKEAGEYTFNLTTLAGSGFLKINNQLVQAFGNRRGRNGVKATLPAGDLPFELMYSKFLDWAKPSLGLAISGPGIREYMISDANVPNGDPVDPILIEANGNTILRSFIDLPGGIRLTHSVNVGNAEGLHYTYDLDNGMLAQAWRGGFLDATPMWHERGDGSSKPTGSIVHFGNPIFSLGKLGSAQDVWLKDSAGTGYHPKGYVLDAADRPSFKYIIYGTPVTDAFHVLENGQGFHRDITIDNPSSNLYYRLAVSDKIEALGNGLYLLDNKAYYLQLDKGNTPVIRDSNGHKELIMPAQNKISYSILF